MPRLLRSLLITCSIQPATFALKSASDFISNILIETTEISPGQATYFLHRVLNCAKAITDSEKLQILSFPEKELLLQSLADNPALCLGLGKKSGGIHSDEALGLKIPFSSESTGLQSDNTLGACPWCQKSSTNRLTLSNHIKWEHYRLTLICHVCSSYHTLCRDVMKSHMKSCNERNHSLVSDKIFYSFGEDWPSDAPKPVRTNMSHAPEMSDDDTPVKSGRQQSSSGKHSSKVSTDKSHAGNVSSSDYGTSDTESESPKETSTPVSKIPASSSKTALLTKSSDKSKCKCKHKSHEHSGNHRSKHSSKKKDKKCKCTDSEDYGTS